MIAGSCVYCGKAKAIHVDHVVSKADRRRYNIDKDDKRYHVKACGPCNWRKMTSRLVPPGYEDLMDELNALMTGTRWRVYSGGPVKAGR